jgi:hypothetical protein
MHYRITDAIADPPESTQRYTERLVDYIFMFYIQLYYIASYYVIYIILHFI